MALQILEEAKRPPLKSTAAPYPFYRSKYRTIDEATLVVSPIQALIDEAQTKMFAHRATMDLSMLLGSNKHLIVFATSILPINCWDTMSPQEIGSELGVQFIVGGTCDRISGSLVLRATLTDSESCRQIWTKRLVISGNLEMENHEEGLSNLTSEICLAVERTAALRYLRSDHEISSSYGHYVTGVWNYYSRNDVSKSIEHLRRSVELDPFRSRARAHLSFVLSQARFVDDSLASETEKEMVSHATQAVGFGSDDAEVLCLAAKAFLINSNWASAEVCSQNALKLNKHDALTHHVRGFVLSYLGDHVAAEHHFARSRMLRPYSPSDWRSEAYLDSLLLAQRYELLIHESQKWVTMPAYMLPEIAAAEIRLGREEQAKHSLEKFLVQYGGRPEPVFGCIAQSRMVHSRHDRLILLESYRLAGLDL